MMNRYHLAPQRTPSRVERELHWRDGRLFLSGLKTLQIERGANWEAYRKLYDYCIIADPSPESIAVLCDPNEGMPWMSKVWWVPAAGPPRPREIGITFWDEQEWDANDPSKMAYNLDRQREIQVCRNRHPNLLVSILAHPNHPSAHHTALSLFLGADVIASDIYMFLRSRNLSDPGGRFSAYFDLQGYCVWLSTVRDAGQACNLPYWLYTQCFEFTEGNTRPRIPTLAENRLQYFVPLAFGFTGFVDWYYDKPVHAEVNRNLMLTDPDGSTRIEYYARHRETLRLVRNLGEVLCRQRNTGVEFGCDRRRYPNGLDRGFTEMLGLNDLRVAVGLPMRQGEPALGLREVHLRADGANADHFLVVGRFREAGDPVDYRGSYFMVTNAMACY